MSRLITVFTAAIPALLLVAGCDGSQSSMPPQAATDSISGPDDQADLDNVALCFHEAVTEYEFYVPDSGHTSRTTIQLAMRH